LPSLDKLIRRPRPDRLRPTTRPENAYVVTYSWINGYLANTSVQLETVYIPYTSSSRALPIVLATVFSGVCSICKFVSLWTIWWHLWTIWYIFLWYLECIEKKL
jgi:hypothetical protein